MVQDEVDTIQRLRTDIQCEVILILVPSKLMSSNVQGFYRKFEGFSTSHETRPVYPEVSLPSSQKLSIYAFVFQVVSFSCLSTKTLYGVHFSPYTFLTRRVPCGMYLLASSFCRLSATALVNIVAVTLHFQRLYPEFVVPGRAKPWEPVTHLLWFRNNYL